MRGAPGPLWALRIVQMEEYVARNSADSIAFNCRRLDVCLGRRVGRGISVIIRVLLGNGAIDLDRRGMLSGHGHGDVSGSHAAGGREYAVRPASQVQGGLARCVRRGRLPAARLVRQRDVRAGRPGCWTGPCHFLVWLVRPGELSGPLRLRLRRVSQRRRHCKPVQARASAASTAALLSGTPVGVLNCSIHRVGFISQTSGFPSSGCAGALRGLRFGLTPRTASGVRSASRIVVAAGSGVVSVAASRVIATMMRNVG
jgi:hypothetical protein